LTSRTKVSSHLKMSRQNISSRVSSILRKREIFKKGI
jgi:hypothetical protein